MSWNIGINTDYNNEWGEQIGQVVGFGPNRLASTVAIVNINDPWKSRGAVLTAVRPILRVYEIEQAMSGTDAGTEGMSDAELKRRARENAVWAVSAIEPLFAVYPGAYWQWYRNEVSIWSLAKFYKYEQVAWVEELAIRGQKASAFGFSVGTPDLDVWSTFDDVVAVLHAAKGIASVHEYGLDGTMQSGWDGVKKVGWHCGRYRRVWQARKYPSLYPDCLWDIGELGLDWENEELNLGGPWKKFNDPLRYIEGLVWVNDNLLVPDGISGNVFALRRDEYWNQYDVHGQVWDALRLRIANDRPRLVQASGGPVVIPDPEPDPTPTPVPNPQPGPALVNPSFEGPTSFYPEDTYGDRKVPEGWQVWYNTNQGAIHVEVDQHPPRVADGQQALRIWCDNHFEGYAGQSMATVPGRDYEATVRVQGRRGLVDPDNSGQPAPKAAIAADLTGGTDFANAVKTTVDATSQPKDVTVKFTAAGPRTTIILKARTGNDFRGDVWFDLVQVKSAAPDLPVPEQPPLHPVTPFRARATAALNARLGLTSADRLIGSLPRGTEVTVIDADDPTALGDKAGRRYVVQVTVLGDYLEPL